MTYTDQDNRPQVMLVGDHEPDCKNRPDIMLYLGGRISFSIFAADERYPVASQEQSGVYIR